MTESVLFVSDGVKRMLERRRRGNPAMATIRNELFTNAKDTGTGLQPTPAPCLCKLSQGGAGSRKGAVCSAG